MRPGFDSRPTHLLFFCSFQFGLLVHTEQQQPNNQQHASRHLPFVWRAPLQHQWHLCVSLVVASPAMNTPIEELRCNECPFVGITRYLGQAVQQRCHRHSDSCMRWQVPALLPRLHLPLGTYCESPRALHTLVGALAVECIVLVLAVAPASCTQNACCDTSTMVSE